MGSKMIKFQNIEDKRVSIWWIVVLCNRCVVMVLSKKKDFVREVEKYGNVQRYGQQSE